ncbi:hypothetical protein MKX03_035566 [Papaver bracteatum]|nr:hypothetical protein MKX03_035566 [Papaver bracteatum]
MIRQASKLVRSTKSVLFLSRHFSTSTHPAVFINRHTRFICQGITENAGSFRCEQAILYKTKLVGGVTPEKGVTKHLGLPVFNSVAEAKAETSANATVIHVPPPLVATAIIDAMNAELDLAVCITGIPPDDIDKVKAAYLDQSVTHLIGPNSLGIIKPGDCRVGIMPGKHHMRGCIGIICRSNPRAYEQVVFETYRVGLGQSTCVSIGGDPFYGTDFTHCILKFLDDPQTLGIVIIGEIGGRAEEDAASLIKEIGTKKPIVAFIADPTTPRGCRMGHIGGTKDAVYEDFMIREAIDNKEEVLREAGVIVVDSAHLVGDALVDCLEQRGLIDVSKLPRLQKPRDELFWPFPIKGQFVAQSDASYTPPSKKKPGFCTIGSYIRNDQGIFSGGCCTRIIPVPDTSVQAEAVGVKVIILFSKTLNCFPLKVQLDCLGVVDKVNGLKPHRGEPIYEEVMKLMELYNVSVEQINRELNKNANSLACLRLKDSAVYETLDELPSDVRMSIKEVEEHDIMGLPHRKDRTGAKDDGA